MTLPDEVLKMAALAVVAAIKNVGEDGEPSLWMMDYEPKTPITEALSVDGEVYPTAIARAAIEAFLSTTGIPVYNPPFVSEDEFKTP